MSKFTLENEAFASFVKYGGLVLLKTVAMSPMTMLCRINTGTYTTEEDVESLLGIKGEELVKNALTKKNPFIERVRAAHLNDVENIIPFSLVSLLYLSTEPDKDTAAILFKTFATFRLLHSAVYLGKVRQPARVVCFLGGLGVNLFMLYKTLSRVW